MEKKRRRVGRIQVTATWRKHEPSVGCQSQLFCFLRFCNKSAVGLVANLILLSGHKFLLVKMAKKISSSLITASYMELKKNIITSAFCLKSCHYFESARTLCVCVGGGGGGGRVQYFMIEWRSCSPNQEKCSMSHATNFFLWLQRSPDIEQLLS